MLLDDLTEDVKILITFAKSGVLNEEILKRPNFLKTAENFKVTLPEVSSTQPTLKPAGIDDFKIPTWIPPSAVKGLKVVGVKVEEN